MKVLITEKQYTLLEGNYIKLPISLEGVRLELYEKENKLQLDAIVIPKNLRKQGYGTKIMKQVIEYSENVGKPIFLSPDTSFGGTSFDRLVKFYKKFGFIKNTEKHLDSHFMVRFPITKNNINESGSSDIIMSLKDLSKMVGRMGYDELSIEIWFMLFRQAFHNHGDEGVMELFEKLTGHRIEPISRGKYVYSYN